jgi:hypothetical protein
MKKRKYILGGIAVLAIAGAVAINVSLNSQKNANLSVFSMANIEVLADTTVEVTIKSGDKCNSGTFNRQNAQSVSCDNPCKMSFNSSSTTSTCP